jgi:hypothetical protein
MRRARKSSYLILAFGIALAASAAEAGWQDEASAFDAGRLGKLAESRAKGISEAEQGAPREDVAVIHSVLDAQPSQVSARELAGIWRCRTIKLGGMTPDVVYSWFKCRIGAHDGRLIFEKLTGSQRTYGTLYPDSSGGYVYLGASSVADEPRHFYSGSGASVGAPGTPDDQIGLLLATGPNSARIEFPYPVQESTFDVIELKR